MVSASARRSKRLVIAELIARRRAHRILIVSPAGPLLQQWHDEMRLRFGLRVVLDDVDLADQERGVLYPGALPPPSRRSRRRRPPLPPTPSLVAPSAANSHDFTGGRAIGGRGSSCRLHPCRVAAPPSCCWRRATG